MTLMRSLLMLLGLAFNLPVGAARPMITDDARIVDAKACQVESWARVNRTGPNQFWAAPACSPVENLELTMAGAMERHVGQTRLSNSLAQGKLLLRPLTTNDWGLALTLGRSIEYGLEPGTSRTPSNYLNVPVSWSHKNDAVLVHLNLGLRNEPMSRQTYATWGLASELQWRPGLLIIAESFGESGNRPFFHAGLRYWLVPDRVQFDATYGTQARWGANQRWISLGMRLMTPAFLP